MSRKTKRRVSDATSGSLVRYLITPGSKYAYLEFRISAFVNLSAAKLEVSEDEISAHLVDDDSKSANDYYADVLYWEPADS